jgi:SAM-dependent methyltransferase
MTNAYGDKIDNTYLSLDTFEGVGQIHRDYIVHCLRWTHVLKHVLRNKGRRILDIGCGQEFPLAKMLRSSRASFDYYAAIDHSKVEPGKYFNKSGKGWEPDRVWSETDFVTIDETELKDINTIVCFEVLEHVEPRHAQQMMQKMSRIIQPGGSVFLSTPCYDPKVGAAKNHVNEMTYEAFGSLIEACGLDIRQHYGTFASQKDYKKKLTPDEASVFDKLNAYYDSNYISTIFAPLYPQYARNCIWECTKHEQDYVPKFGPLQSVGDTPSSSDKWDDLDI